MNWIRLARRRWPKRDRERVGQDCGVNGDGPLAVLKCTYFHPSVRYNIHGGVFLFATLEEAQAFKFELDKPGAGKRINGFLPYCHAYTKGLCSGDHQLVDLREA